MPETQPKHKPNEKHTLDEVLKSLKDLVGNEVLDRPPPPAAPPRADARFVPPSADMQDIIGALEDLLDRELSVEDAPGNPPPARPTPAEEPDAQPAIAEPPRDLPATKPFVTAAKTETLPAPEVAPPPAATPMLESGDDLEWDLEALPAPASDEPKFPDEMSDDDIAKALAEIELGMGAEAAAAAEAEPESVEAAAPPEPTAATPPVPEVKKPAPPLELTVVETPNETPAQAQHELTFATVLRSAPDTGAKETSTPEDSGLRVVEEEIAAAPAPEPFSAPSESSDEPSTADDSETIDLAPAPESPESPAASEPVFDGDYSIDFSPPKPDKPASIPEPEDLAPPVWEEDDNDLQRAEPPVDMGPRESAHGSNLNDDSHQLPLSRDSGRGQGVRGPSPSGGRNEDGGGVPYVPHGHLGESIELDVGATPASGSDAVVDLESVTQELPQPEPAPAAAAAPPDAPAIPKLEIVENENSPLSAQPSPRDGEVTFESLDDTIDLDLGETPAAQGSDAVVEFEPAPAVDESASTEPAAATPPSESSVPQTEVIEAAAPPEPPAAPARPAKEIPVLKNVAGERKAPSEPPPPETFALDFAPATPPKPTAHDLHQMTVRVIAKLNIELRKGGKPPLDAKTINRLQQLLKEALKK